MHSKRVVKVLAAAVTAMTLTAAAAPAASAQSLQINVLSTRANLVSGGQALTSIDLPAGTDPTTVAVSRGD